MAEYTTLEMIDELFDLFHPDGPEVAFMSGLREKISRGVIPSSTDMEKIHRLKLMLNPAPCEYLATNGKCKFDETIGQCTYIDEWTSCGYYMPEQPEDIDENKPFGGLFEIRK